MTVPALNCFPVQYPFAQTLQWAGRDWGSAQHAMLNSATNAQADAGSVAVEVVAIAGGALNPGPSIAAYAEAKGAELLVVGSRGIGAVAGCDTGTVLLLSIVIASFCKIRDE